MSCIKCKLIIDERSDKFIKCDICNRSIHIICSELSDAEIKCFTLRPTSRRRVKYICFECEQNVNQIPKLITLIGELQKELKNLNDRFTDLKNSTVMNASPSVLVSTEEIISEMYDRNRRAQNIIVYGSLEEGNSKHEQIQKDVATVQDLLTEVGVDCDQLKPMRLGRFDASVQQRSRPIRVRLLSSDDVFKVLRKFKNVKNHPRLVNLSVSVDRTPRQIALYRAIKSELAERISNGETNLKIKYRNGSPTIIQALPNSGN